eukprot:gnl/TRDRNA2_/TRDRNA2_172030_c4_seq1.p1 gnl/TRDRNA2_/TRDRNA2_172030_c4~~gnl/TRDRNA2_/TRDRNA2_172030_c4_seq1.p1  ORF type:complete len:214 (-),score=30.48 gnl/TRDRNA2_/TRDRNA2_172030_c4_seq1:37-678(-)
MPQANQGLAPVPEDTSQEKGPLHIQPLQQNISLNGDSPTDECKELEALWKKLEGRLFDLVHGVVHGVTDAQAQFLDKLVQSRLDKLAVSLRDTIKSIGSELGSIALTQTLEDGETGNMLKHIRDTAEANLEQTQRVERVIDARMQSLAPHLLVPPLDRQEFNPAQDASAPGVYERMPEGRQSRARGPADGPESCTGRPEHCSAFSCMSPRSAQ